MFRSIPLFLAAMLVISPCMARAAESVSSDVPKQYKHLYEYKSKKSSKKKNELKRFAIRAKALAESARTLAFQHAVRHQYNLYMKAVENRGNDFDRIFNFTQLVLGDKMLPPVIRWAGDSMELHDYSHATTVEAQYIIEAPARIVTLPPSWRDYLIMGDLEVLDNVSVEILPETSEEISVWKSSISEGWAEGIEYAKELFEINMSRLEADYRGILRYKMLMDEGLVAPPILAEGQPRIKIGGNTLTMNERVFRITVPARFVVMEKHNPKPARTGKSGGK